MFSTGGKIENETEEIPVLMKLTFQASLADHGKNVRPKAND